jgi:hypothetical protein
LILKLIASFAAKCWSETVGVANGAVGWTVFKSIAFSRAADWAMMQPRI